MTAKISSQSTALTGQSAVEALLRNENSENSSENVSSKPKKKLDASYELSLSEAAQSMKSAALPSVSTPEEAKKQLDLIKAAVAQSTTAASNAHTPNAKTVIDLLA